MNTHEYKISLSSDLSKEDVKSHLGGLLSNFYGCKIECLDNLTEDEASAYILGYDTANRLEIGVVFTCEDAQKFLGNGATEKEINQFVEGASRFVIGNDSDNKYENCLKILN